jgi:hypothetical protein
MKIIAHKCLTCKDILYSRAIHDFRTCECGKTSVDGGFDYTRLVFKKEKPESIEVNVNATKGQLYDDWNNESNKYGIIKPETYKWECWND